MRLKKYHVLVRKVVHWCRKVCSDVLWTMKS